MYFTFFKIQWQIRNVTIADLEMAVKFNIITADQKETIIALAQVPA